MLNIFSKFLTLRKVMCLIILETALVMMANSQTRTVYKFEHNEPIPSFNELKDQLDLISSKTVNEFRDALNISDKKATAVMDTISPVLVMIEQLSNCHKLATEAGWTEQQISQLAELHRKSISIYRRLKRIQDKAFHRVALRGSLLFI